MFYFSEMFSVPDWIALCFLIIVIFLLIFAFLGSNETQKIPTYLENEKEYFTEKFEGDQ